MLPRTMLTTLALVLPATHAFVLLATTYKAPDATLGAMHILSYDSCHSKLVVSSSPQVCGALPSWLELSHDRKSLMCINENDPGSLTYFKAVEEAKDRVALTPVSEVSTLGGPVSAAWYGNGTGVAIAHYAPPAISTFLLSPITKNTLLPRQNFTFNLSSVDPERQKTSHIHQALLDPTKGYLVFPDLGADRVHVFAIDSATNGLKEMPPLTSKPGYGPRHAAFWTVKIGDAGKGKDVVQVFMFVIHELSNKIVSYSVMYGDAGIKFEQVDEVSTFGNQTAPKGAAAAEIVVSPDNKFLLASNRLAPIFHLANPDPKNSTKIPSDSLVTFKPNSDGKLEFVDLAPSGGMNPRHFSLNKGGSMVAVGNVAEKNVVVFKRDTKTGKTGEQVAVARGLSGDVTNVQWFRE